MDRLKTFDSLRFFAAAAHHLNFTMAGNELGVSQSAVSQQIGKLESGIGFQLFERQARGLILTEKGAKFWDAVREGLGQIDLCLRDIDDTRLTGNLTVRTLPSFATRWLLPRIDELRDCTPGLNIVIDSNQSQPNFLSDGVDIAITYGKGDHPEWDQSFLFNDTIFPVCTPDFLQLHRITSPGELRGEHLLHDSVPQAMYSTSWDAWFASLGMSMPHSGTGPAFHTLDLVCKSALKGEGVAMGRHSLVATDIASGRLVKLFDHTLLEDGFYLACPNSHLQRKVIQKFYEWTTEQAALFRAETPLY